MYLPFRIGCSIRLHIIRDGAELEELKERILNQRIRSQKIENAIKEWTGMGFKISKLENALRNDIEEAEIFEDYSNRIKELMDYEARLKEMNPRDIQDQVHRIHLKIKNPELIESIRKEMSQIQDGCFGKDPTEENGTEALLKTWKSQGYEIDTILTSTGKENTIEGLEKVILRAQGRLHHLNPSRINPQFMRGDGSLLLKGYQRRLCESQKL